MYIACSGWYKKELPLDAHLCIDLKTDGDDITAFVMQLEKYFDMRLTDAQWDGVFSLRQTVDLIMQYRGAKLRPPEPERSFWGKLWNCIK